MKKLLNSFKYAFEGIDFVVRTQRNMKIHIFIALIVIILGFIVSLNTYEWMILILTISFVIVAETINTAIEIAIDLCTKEKNILAKIAKDIAAGAVLISAFTSIIVGYLLFISRLF